MSGYQHILFSVEDGVAVITFNRPQVLNAINYDVIHEFHDIVEDLFANDTARAVIITGSGKAFIAGADIAALRSFTAAQGREFTLYGQRIMHRLEELPKPVIGAINGYAFGGGFELALACDIRIASSRAKMGLPEVKLGIFPGYGGTQRLTRLTNYCTAKYLIFTGEPITAQRAYEMGIVQEVVEPEELMNAALTLAKKIMANGPISVGMAKRAINMGMHMDLTSACAFEAENYAFCFASEDRIEGMDAFLEKREPRFPNK